jgi:hypothetical protein
MLHLSGFNHTHPIDVLDKRPHRGHFTLILALDLRKCTVTDFRNARSRERLQNNGCMSLATEDMLTS